MALLASLSLILLAGSAYCSPSRIVGGTETTIERYPSIAGMESYNAVSSTWNQGCAASILTSRYLVSAAHCFNSQFINLNNRRFRAGSSYRLTGGSLHYVEAFYNHPTWGLSGYDGDINVIRVINPFVYSDQVQPVTIVSAGYQIPDNVAVVHAGWGHTSFGGTFSPVLLYTQIYTINNDLCTTRYLNREPRPAYVTPNMICAGILDVGGKDACQGDSGGPLYLNDILVGVVSWGHECANETYPGVSTAVSPYTDWIISVAV